MDIDGTNVVVTGGAGFIGSHVVDRLVQLGANVVVVDDLSVGRRANLVDAEAAGARFYLGDVRNRAHMDDVMRGANLVLHMSCANLRASLADPMSNHDINATGALVAALAAVDAGVDRFVYVSSSEAYGSAVRQPMAEDHPLVPTTVYGAAKAAGELYSQSVMRRYGMPVAVIRPFNSYGPREHSSGTSAEVIPKFTARILAGEAPVIFGDGHQTRDFTWVEETAAGICAAAASDALVGEAVNIAYGEGVSVSRICAELLDILGRPDLRPRHEPERPGDVEHHFADVSKAHRVLGWRPQVAVREGLERYVEWVLAGGDQVEEPEVARVRNW